MNSSLDRTVTAGRVLSAEHTATLPVASLLTAQSAGLFLSAPEPQLDEETVAARVSTAYEQGFAAGAEQARAAGLANREQTLERCRRQLDGALSELIAQRDSVLRQLATDSVDLVLGLLHELVGAELQLRENAAREAVLRALALAPPEVDLIVRVHPGSELASDEFAAIFPATSIRIVHDPAVEPTGAVVEAGPCRIDAQIGPALERVRAVLVAGLGSGQGPE